MLKNLKYIFLVIISTVHFTSVASEEIIPVAIIGSGCAGLSAAYSISEYGFKTVIFSGKIKGGDLNAKTEVGNWLGVKTTMGNEIMPRVIDTALSFGAEIVESQIENVDFSSKPFKLTDSHGKTYYAHKLIIATGATERLLEVPGAKENRSRILYNWDIHKNVEAYKASARNKKVVVIGGGIDAMKKAFYAIRGGAKEVKLLVRGSNLKTPPWRKRFLSFKSGVVKIIYNCDVDRIDSIDANKLRITSKDNKSYDADIVVSSIGMTPRSTIFKPSIKTNTEGFIVINAKTQETNISGVFACGDVTDASGPQPQALIAVGNGMIAGYSVVKELLEMNLSQDDVLFKKAKSMMRNNFKNFGKK